MNLIFSLIITVFGEKGRIDSRLLDGFAAFYRKQFFNVFPNYIDFDVNFAAALQHPKRCYLHGMWYDRYTETTAPATVNRQTDAVNCDGAFFNDISILLLREREGKDPKITILFDRRSDTDTVNMSGDKMATESI